MHQDSESVALAKRYLRGDSFPFSELNKLWDDLKRELEFAYARQVLALLRDEAQLAGAERPDLDQQEKLCQQHALCTSKDPDLSAAERHDAALEILKKGMGLGRGRPRGGQETLGIAGGICKRKWEAFGQIEDLESALEHYEQGYKDPAGVTGDYGYTGINTAFVLDLLATLGAAPEVSRARAARIRQEILDDVAPLQQEKEWLRGEWWFYVTLAEASLGLGKYDQAIGWVREGVKLEGTPSWEFETTARQFVALAGLRPEEDLEATKAVIAELVKDSGAHVDDVLVGKVGLALSGGGFRASLYHLGVLAHLAERDVLRHVQVLSCVSGGSILGAHYYLALRALLLERSSEEVSHADYIELVQQLIAEFKRGVTGGVREAAPDGLADRLKKGWQTLQRQGAMDPELVASKLEEVFYKRGAPDVDTLWLDALNFEPKGHDHASLGRFHPKRHNWRRRHKVPALVLNATTVNTGHCWQFTTMSMGETPFALHDEVDSVPRLRRAWYRPDSAEDPGRRISLGRAVAASAAVPGVFQPLLLEGLYPAGGEPFTVRLVDGGVFDNQGLVGLLAADCSVLIVSDAAGQLTEEHRPAEGARGTLAFAGRAVSMLMERIRQSGYSALKTRRQAKMLRGLMFIHMKAGLYAEPVAWAGCQESYQPPRETVINPDSGVRRDFQERLANVRTDLDDFTAEADYLIACGYQMAKRGFENQLAGLAGLGEEPPDVAWEFRAALDLIVSVDEDTATDRARVLAALERGAAVGSGSRGD